MTEDMSQFLGVFLDEASEQLEVLERDILALEHASSQELLQQIFRAAHTLKGSSRAMGFTAMGELTHAMEDVFDKLRNDEMGVNGELINALFAGLDALKAMLEDIAASGDTTVDTTVQTARLRVVLEGGSAPPVSTAKKVVPVAAVEIDPGASSPAVAPQAPAFRNVLTASQQEAVRAAVATGSQIFAANVKIADDCVMKSVRALMVLQAFERTGSVLATSPNEEALEGDDFGDDFEVVIATSNGADAIRAAAGSITEIRDVDVSPWWDAESPLRQVAEAVASASNPTMVLSAAQEEAMRSARASNYAIFRMVVHVSAECVMKSVRALMTLQAVEQVGSVLAITPNEEALENEEFESEFEILVATTNGADALRNSAASITEIREVVVTAWTDGESESTSAAERREVVSADPNAVVTGDLRQVDAGPEARGKAPEEIQKIAAEKKAPAQAQTVRVDVSRLDKLLNLVGELVIDRTRIAQLGAEFEQRAVFSDLVEHLNEASAHIGRITDELQEEIMKARMLPIDNVFSRFPRMVRDLAQNLNKEIDFVVEGKETELDRSVIEVIGDPLIHMLRNSVDHGVEMPDEREKAGKPRMGTVWLRARHEESHIVIEIQDDGKGLNPQKLRENAVKKGMMTADAAARLTEKEAMHLIFASGFSTATVVSDVSGRGVGMDIVRSNLQRLGASIEIDSQVGVGSTFTVKLPLTLAIIRGLLVNVRGCVYALPLVSVVETIKIEASALHQINHQEVILQRGKTLPIVRLKDIFHLESAVTPAERTLENDRVRREETTSGSEAPAPTSSAPSSLYLVVVGMADKQVGLVVDSLIGEQEVVIKSLGTFIGDIQGISGATILGDGRVALIVDINGIISAAKAEKGRSHAS